MKKTGFLFASVFSCAALCASFTQSAFADDAKVLSDLCALNVLVHMPVKAAKQIRFPIVSIVSNDPSLNLDQVHGYGYSIAGATEILAGGGLSAVLDKALGKIMGTDCYYGTVALTWQEEDIAKNAAIEAAGNLQKGTPVAALYNQIVAAEKAFVMTSLELVKKQASKFKSDIDKALATRKDYFSDIPGVIKPVKFQGREYSKEALRQELQNFSGQGERVLPEVRSFYDSAIEAVFNGTFDAWLIEQGL